MLIEISSIKGNSGQGSPLFSRPGLMHNTMHMAFNKGSAPRKPPTEEQPFDFQKWKQDIAEMDAKKKFHKALERFETKQTRQTQKEKLLKLGFSAAPPKEGEEPAPKRADRNIAVPLIGEIKKDKLKHSQAMSVDEKERLAARERNMSRNRGVCMVSVFSAWVAQTY